MKKKMIFFVAGGSGGHILPALILAQKAKEEAADAPAVIFFTTSAKTDKTVIENYRSKVTFIFSRRNKVPGKKVWLYPFFLLSCGWLFLKSIGYMAWYRPQRVVTTGGFDALIMCFVAWIARVPIDLYELNAVPGKAASLIARWAQTVFIIFDSCQKFFPACATQRVGYPLRFTDKDRGVKKEDVFEKVNAECSKQLKPLFSPHRFTIFVLAGSQGALSINNLMRSWIMQGGNTHEIQIIHQVGLHDTFDWASFYKNLSIPALTFTYREDIALFYACCDLIITRAGAGTLFEIEFFKKKCMIIPLKTTCNNHQVQNAYEMVRKNNTLFTLYVDSGEQTLQKFDEVIKSLMQH